MAQAVTLPFTIQRSTDVIGAGAITQTKETVHGLLRVHGEKVTIEWRTFRKTDHVGPEIRTDREVGPVRTVTVSLRRIAGAFVRRNGLPWPFKPRIVLTANDLQAFEEIAGETGLQLAHPAELVLTLRRADRLRAYEFAAELALAVAEIGAGETAASSLPGAEDRRLSEDSRPSGTPGPSKSD
jgi:hypothetical protein